MKKFLPILLVLCATLCACQKEEPIQPKEDVYITKFTIVNGAEYTTNYEVTFTGVDKTGKTIISSPVYRAENVSGGDLPYTYTLNPSLYIGTKGSISKNLDYMSVTLNMINYDEQGNKYTITLINGRHFFPLIVDEEETYTITNEYGHYTILVDFIRR